MSFMQLLPIVDAVDEQKKYYQKTEKERLRNQQQYPGLSNKGNYVSPPGSHLSRAEEVVYLIWFLIHQTSSCVNSNRHYYNNV